MNCLGQNTPGKGGTVMNEYKIIETNVEGYNRLDKMSLLTSINLYKKA